MDREERTPQLDDETDEQYARRIEWLTKMETLTNRALIAQLWELTDELAARDAAIEKVREQHPKSSSAAGRWCLGCGFAGGPWPCATVRALSVLDSEETQ